MSTQQAPPSGTPPTSPEHAPALVASELHLVGGKYRLEERLGEGGLGVVYRAVHLGLEKSFAVKLLKTAGPPSPAALARFRQEAVALGRLQHAHIVDVTDSGIDDASGLPYLVMERLQGVPLAETCRDGRALPFAQALHYLAQIASAVDAAHGAGILHRDLKPANVLLTASGVKVLDFGLAELLGAGSGTGSASAIQDGENPRLTATGALQGTPLYAAPEVIRSGEASRASDVYSFGVIAYELLGGRPPFQGPVAQVLQGHLEAEPPALPLPPEIGNALREPLQKDPALRPATAGEVIRRLQEGAAQAERARWRSTEIPRRVLLASLLATLLLAVAFRLPWPPIPAIEQWIGDWRMETAPPRSPDPRILLVAFDQASLDSSPLPLGARGDELGRALARIFEAGARGVAVDFLLPTQWSASQDFSDLVLRHSEHLTLAASSESDGRVNGTECIKGLTTVALGPRRAAELFGFVNLDVDADGVSRRGRLGFLDRSGQLRPSWAARAASRLRAELRWDRETPREFWIDARIDWPRYDRISWRQLPTVLQRNPALFQDRLVLVGGDFRGSGDDLHYIPSRSGKNRAVSGLTLQALMVDTITAGLPVRETGKTPVLALAAVAAALAMAGILGARRVGLMAVGIAASAGSYLALSFPVFWRTGLMLPVTSPLLLVLLGLLATLALRKVLPSPPEVSPP